MDLNNMLDELSINMIYKSDSINGSRLTEQSMGFYVKSGRVDLFFTRLQDGKPRERLHYVTSMLKGEMYFGIAEECFAEGFAAYLKCTQDTSVIPIDLKKISVTGEQDEFNLLIFQYMRRVAELLPASAGLDAFRLQPGVSIAEMITGFNRKASVAIMENIMEKKKNSLARLQAKLKLDAQYRQKGLETLATVVEDSRNHGQPLDDTVPATPQVDPLAEACRLVFSRMDITIKLPPLYIMNKSGNPVGEIVRASQIRHRKVTLKDSWYRMDNGPILGFLSDGSPVALLPVTPTKYKMINPETGQEKPVSKELAASLMPGGYMFYKPLPAKKLDLKDIIKFCLRRDLLADATSIVGLGLAGGFLGLLPPVITGLLFESIIPEGRSNQLFQAVFILVAFAGSAVFLQLVRSFATLRIESKLDNALQAAVWDRILSLPAPFFRKYTAGELASRAMGINTIRQTLSGAAMNTILTSVFSLFNLGLLFFYSKTMAILAVMITVVNLGIVIGSSVIQIKFEREQIKVSNKLSGKILQLIQGIPKIRTSGAENRAFFQWSSDFSAQRKLTFKSSSINNFVTVFNSIFTVASSMIIFFAATCDSNLDLGGYIAFNAAFGSFNFSIASLSGVLMAVNSIGPIYENTRPILETIPEYDELKEDPGELDGSIEVKHVSFKYDSDGPDILRDVSLKIGRGEYIGIVGASGSGKSTLLRVLLGFEKPYNGKVYYGGHDLESIDLRSVRRQMGIVLQNGKLISGDIYTNIVGAAGLTLDDAWEAARLAGLEQDIKDMPMGMFTMVGEGTSVISGGQRQRLMIARAIVRKPSILMFDEATSALDNNTQSIVTKSLEGLKATRIVIAHRLSTVMNCDRIIVMDKGTVVEEGSYSELMEKKGMFHALVARQVV